MFLVGEGLPRGKDTAEGSPLADTRGRSSVDPSRSCLSTSVQPRVPCGVRSPAEHAPQGLGVAAVQVREWLLESCVVSSLSPRESCHNGDTKL